MHKPCTCNEVLLQTKVTQEDRQEGNRKQGHDDDVDEEGRDAGQEVEKNIVSRLYDALWVVEKACVVT